MREKIEQLVAENGEAAWLQADDRNAAANFRPQAFRESGGTGLGRLEHAGVVQGPSATEDGSRDLNLVARRLQHLDGGLADLGMKVVVERVGPEDDVLIAVVLWLLVTARRTSL